MSEIVMKFNRIKWVMHRANSKANFTVSFNTINSGFAHSCKRWQQIPPALSDSSSLIGCVALEQG